MDSVLLGKKIHGGSSVGLVLCALWAGLIIGVCLMRAVVNDTTVEED